MYKKTPLTIDDRTLRRMNEIELTIYHSNFTELLGFMEATRTLSKLLNTDIDNAPHVAEIFQRHNYPSKFELVIYLLHKDYSYNQITQELGTSSASIKKYKDKYMNDPYSITPLIFDYAAPEVQEMLLNLPKIRFLLAQLDRPTILKRYA